MEKIRRQKSKASQFKEKFGLGSGSAGVGAGAAAGPTVAAAAAKLAKSKSVCVPSPTLEELPDLTRGGQIPGLFTQNSDKLLALAFVAHLESVFFSPMSAPTWCRFFKEPNLI